MSVVQRCDGRPMRRTACKLVVALGCAAGLAACGGGISLDPSGSKAQSNDQVDAADVLDAGAGDVSLDGAGVPDSVEEIDASATPDVTEDSSADATETISVDAKRDGDIAEEAFDDGSGDSEGAVEDAGDDSADAPIDAASETGDGCTLACGWPEADYYVDAHASSDGNGSRFEPFNTITRAIAAYRVGPREPKSVYVAAGTYDRALGEEFPLVLRGLSLKGAGRDETFIIGTGLLDHAAEGGAFHGQYLVTLVAGDGTLKTGISDVSVRSESPVPVLNYYGVFCDRGSATGEVAAPAGQTELARVSVGPGYQASVLATTSTSTVPAVTGCNIVIRSSLLTGGWAGLRAYGCDPMRLSGPVLVEMGGADASSGNIVSWMQAPGDGAAGASLEGCVIRASFQNNAFVDGVYGLRIRDNNVPFGSFGPRPITIRHNSFERLRAGGILAEGNFIIDELSDNRFVGISRAATQDPGPRAIALSIGSVPLGKARRNQFIGNDSGVLVAVPSEGGQAVDFGTSDDPGNNVFRCNSSLKEAGADFSITGDAGWMGTIHLAGNAWDHAPPTVVSIAPIPNGCDIGAAGVPQLVLNIGKASLATPACPADRVPGQ